MSGWNGILSTGNSTYKIETEQSRLEEEQDLPGAGTRVYDCGGKGHTGSWKAGLDRTLRILNAVPRSFGFTY